MSFIALSLMASAALTPETTPETTPDDPVIEAAVAAIEKGEVEELRPIFSNVHRMLSAGPVHEAPSHVLDKLSGCAAEELRRYGGADMPFYSYGWTCADETYHATIVPDGNGVSLSFVDVMTLAKYEELRSRPFAPPRLPPPPPGAPKTPAQIEAEKQAERQRIATTFARASAVAYALVEGNVEGLSNRMTDSAPVSLYFQDPFLGQRFVEKRGGGGEAMAEQLAFLNDTLGMPSSYSCTQRNRRWDAQMCQWQFERIGVSLVGTFKLTESDDNNGWRIRSMDFTYATPERLAEAAKRNVN